MRTLVTGAAGFVGRAVVAHLLATRGEGEGLVLADRAPFTVDGAAVEVRVGDLSEDAVMDGLVEGVDRVIHLAALPGGASEADYPRSLAVNLHASLDLMERCAAAPAPMRFVYSSSIAVFGAHGSTPADDETPPRPQGTYGAHKLMVETALANLARLGRLDAVALRLPGVVARPRGPSGLKSAFMSEVFHALAAHEAYTSPVSPEATVWIMSAAAAAEALVHALDMPPLAAGQPRAITAPALRVTLAGLVEAIAAATGADAADVTYAPDATLEAQFGRLPPLATPLADSLGFRHDGGLDALVRRSLRDLT
jgi:nucleoside-diphosphate-sugar epimerase